MFWKSAYGIFAEKVEEHGCCQYGHSEVYCGWYLTVIPEEDQQGTPVVWVNTEEFQRGKKLWIG